MLDGSDEEIEEVSVPDGSNSSVSDEKIPRSSEPLDLDVSIDDYIDEDENNANGDNGLSEFSEEFLTRFCRDASRAFFDEHGLISHQLNSYNDFIDNGIQKLFDSIGEIVVEPDYDPSKKSEGGRRHASITFGKVTLEEPKFWTGEKAQDELKVVPRHARLQNMTYSSRMKVVVKLQVDCKRKPPNFVLENRSYVLSTRRALPLKQHENVTLLEHVIQMVYVQELIISEKGKSGRYVGRKILSEEEKDIVIGRIPVMVKSKLCWLHKLNKDDCPFDHGGYFLIKGMEKRDLRGECETCGDSLVDSDMGLLVDMHQAFIAQEERCPTRIWVTNKPGWSAQYMSVFKRRRIYVKLAENRRSDGGAKVITVYFFYQTFPLWILFFALGALSDKEVIQMIDLDVSDSGLVNILLSTVADADANFGDFRKQGKALEYINGRVMNSKIPPQESIEECIRNYLFPSFSSHKQKALFLGYMVKCLLLSYSGKRKCENKDDFRNKRLDLTGELLARELRVHIKHAERRLVKTMQRDLSGDRSVQFIERYLDASIITNGLSRAFSTGSWCHPYKVNERCHGVVAGLRRTNPLQMMSDLRKTRQRVPYTGVTGDARFPNPSFWGKVCFLSTPDGENCGLVKNLAVTGLVSTKLVEVPLDKLVSCGMEHLEEDTLLLNGKHKILLNGNWVGVCRDSSSFVRKLRNMRRNKQIDSKVEIKRDQAQAEVRIFSDSGRILRPLLIVENLKNIKYFKGGPYSFQTLLDQKVVELIGVEEEEDCQVAWGIKYLVMGEKDQPSPKYTHCELDLSFLLGLSCGIMPFANHNFARRILYQSEKHSQQAIGFCTLNPNIRVDTLSHQLYYPQRPLFRTMLSDSLGKPESQGQNNIMSLPQIFNGQNAIVAVNVHQGYNQEDSLVMNRASLERGMFRTEHHRSYKAEVENKEILETKRLKFKDRVDFCKMQSKIGRVDSLDDDGFPYIGANLQSGDIVIGKGAESGADHSVKLKHTERGKVQKVILSANDDGKNFAVVTLRQVRSPCLGDKFSSMHGQKGVVGLLESQENFPFTLQGIVPDIVINPHAFPTRQTPGQLLEAALGKGIACGGSVRYATPFTTASVDVITDQLHRAGYSRWGSERVYNGRTGEMVRSLIFMGPTFYQRLIHMAEDKVKFRNTGPVHPLTRQPVADRKRFGGVKFGEMERDCLLAHGAAANLYERLFMLSDFSQMFICQKCTRVANVIQRTVPNGKKVRGPFCRFCNSAESIVKVNVPYGAKLLYQELFSMGICLKFETEVC